MEYDCLSVMSITVWIMDIHDCMEYDFMDNVSMYHYWKHSSSEIQEYLLLDTFLYNLYIRYIFIFLWSCPFSG